MIRHLVLASAIITGCIELPPGDMTDPHYWGQVFLDKYATERHDALAAVATEPAPAPMAHPRTVLLITGVTIPAEWFGPIKLRLERDGFRTVVYEPPDLLAGDLFHNAELLGDVIERVAHDSGQDKIDVLAECTGGLITRYYIQSMGGDQYVSRLVTFISPQHGVDKAPLAAGIAGWPALYDLSPGSEWLDAVNSQSPPDDVAVTSIYTCTDEFIQPYETSIIPGATNIGIGCDGTFVGHYSFFWDRDIYMLMYNALIAPSPGDPTDPGDPGDPGDDPSDDPNDDPTDPSADPDTGGCSTSGAGGSGGAIILVGAALIATRRRRARA